MYLIYNIFDVVYLNILKNITIRFLNNKEKKVGFIKINYNNIKRITYYPKLQYFLGLAVRFFQ